MQSRGGRRESRPARRAWSVLHSPKPPELNVGGEREREGSHFSIGEETLNFFFLCGFPPEAKLLDSRGPTVMPRGSLLL